MNMVKDYPTPTFTTESSNMIVNEGDTVRLPCIVDRLEGFVMLWKRGNEIVTVASQIIDKVRLRRPIIIRQICPDRNILNRLPGFFHFVKLDWKSIEQPVTWQSRSCRIIRLDREVSQRKSH